MKLCKIAKKFPGPVRQSLKTMYGAIPAKLRFGRAFWDTYNFLMESQWWDAARLQEYQMRELQRLLVQCYENVPYYRRVFDERGLKPSQIQSLEDLKKLPYLRKADIRKEPQVFVARNRRPNRLERQGTTGTTGQPFQFFLDHAQRMREWAFVCHQWSRVGYRPGDLRAELWGPPIEGCKPYWWDPARGILRLSPAVGGRETIQLYMDLMRHYGIRFFFGYTSMLTHLASLIKQYGVAPNLDLTAILFSSENSYPWQRSIVEEVFGCGSCSHYGLSEEIVMASDCEACQDYHCIPQYGITEIDPQTGEIIGTGFLNHANPFVRYKTGDIAVLPTQHGCEKCSRQYYPIISGIEGRVQEFIVTSQGIPVNHSMLSFPFKPCKTISRVQLVQDALDRVRLRAAPVDDSSSHLFDQELAGAGRALQAILGHDMQITNERISPEECMTAGKFRFIVSHLQNPFPRPDGGGGRR